MGCLILRLVTVVVCLCVTGLVFAQGQSSSYTKDYRREALEIFDDIIAMRTAAGQGNVPAMAEYLADRFRDGGFDEEDIHIIPYTEDSGEEVASLVVRYRGNGLANKKPILLLAHMDVVDAVSNLVADHLLERVGHCIQIGVVTHRLR